MRLAVCPGSFDPITIGHLDMIQRACALFDRIIVLVSHNPDKQCVFSPEQRRDFIQRVTADLPQVSVEIYDGLLVDYVRQSGAVAIVKGLRQAEDYEYEMPMAIANRALCPTAETIFLPSRAEHLYFSSSLVRQVGSFGGDISAFVPQEIAAEVGAALQRK